MSPTVQKTIRIFVVDDHPIVCRGLIELINQEDDLHVIGNSESAEEALGQILELEPDIVLADLRLKGMGGIELIRSLKARLPELPILVVSMHDETLYAQRAIRAGAKGYVMKEVATEKLLEALRTVLEGHLYVSESVKEKLIQTLMSGSTTNSEDRDPLDGLSDRELQVYEFIGEGLKTREIAERLHLAVKTIEAYRANIKQKLGLKDYMELVTHAITHRQGKKHE